MQELLGLLRSYLRGMWMYRWWGLAASVLVGVGGVMFVMGIPNRYEASARVYVDTQSILKPLMSGLAVQPNVDQQIAMVSRTLISRPNVERVVRMADLDLTARTPKERDAIVDSLMKEIQLGAAGGMNLYFIGYRSTEPEQARKVVQALLSLFVESNLGDKKRDASQARKFIDDQIKAYETRLLEAENALKEFKIRNINQMVSTGLDSVSRGGDIAGQLTQARMELSQAEDARDELRKQLSIEPQQIPGDRPMFETSASGSGAVTVARRSPYDERIDAQRKRLDELQLRFTDQHPDVVGVRRVIEQLEAQRDAESKAEAAKSDEAKAAGMPAPQTRQTSMTGNPVYQQLRVSLAESEANVASLRARVRDLDARLKGVRSQATTAPKVEAEHTQLMRDYEITKRNYEQLVSRRESAQLTGEMEATGSGAEFRIVDPPRVSPQPVSPQRGILLLGVLFVSLAAGAAATLLRDQLRPTFLDLRSLRSTTSLPILGAVSWISDPMARARSRRALLLFSGGATAYIVLFGMLLALVWYRQLGH